MQTLSQYEFMQPKRVVGTVTIVSSQDQVDAKSIAKKA